MGSETVGRKSSQSRACRVVVLALIVAIGFGLAHSVLVHRYLRRVNAEHFSDPGAESTASADRPDLTLGIAADGRTWIRVTEERIRAEEWRLAHTQSDGGAEGRAVYWSSAWSAWLEALGRVHGLWSELPRDRALVAASFWAQFPLWCAALLVMGGVLYRAAGGWAAAIGVGVLAACRGFYVAFYPGYPDHHGAIALCSLLCVVGWVPARFGASTGSSGARRMVLVSAIGGAAALALSAASAMPVLAALGLTGLVCRGAAMRAGGSASLPEGARLWRWWGRAGASAAALFYLAEFFPDRMGWRLEVNHPVYALAWWGGAELIAWWWRRASSPDTGTKDIGWLCFALVSIAAPVLCVGVGGSKVFVLADPFLSGVHRHITEFFPIWRISGSAFWLFLLSLPPFALVPLAWRRLGVDERVNLVGLTVLAAMLTALAVWQHRWWSLAAVAQAPLAGVVGASLISGMRGRGGRLAMVMPLLAGCVLPGPVLLLVEQFRIARVRDVQAPEAMQLLYRDLGTRLAAATPGRRPVLLASPDVALSVAYYGDFRAVGTLYWENNDGLRTAAEALTETDDVAAKELLVRAGVTHILLVAPHDFTAQYLSVRAETGGRVGRIEETLGRRLLDGRNVPTWACALPYAVPPQFGRMGVRVALYAFEPEMPLVESRRALGVARLVAGDETGGMAALREAANLGSAEAGLLWAWRLATARALSTAEARDVVTVAQAAVDALAESPANRRVLAACFAAAKRWPEAQACILGAIDLAQERGDAAMVAELERDFSFYRDFRSPFESTPTR